MVKMPNWPKPMFQNNIKLGLERIGKLLKVLGNPHQYIPPVIHITGTNGKGSTLSFIKSILEHANYKIHSYTSPHLINFNERIKIAGTNISDQEISELSEICRIVEEKLDEKVTFFEGVTVMAMLAFKNIKADFTLLEVGMGGRLDATNIVTNTIASVITPISYDHTEQLGGTISQIAFEKCGILRSNSLGIISMQTEEASKVINEYAKRVNTKLYEYEYDFGCRLLENEFVFMNDEGKANYPLPSLIGDHQIINVTTAIETIKKLKLNIDNKIIAKAIQNTYWPGRLERLKEGKIIDKLSDGWQIWLDGAHNDSGAQILANWAIQNRDLPLYIICGMTKGRSSDNFLSYFQEVVNFVIGVKVENESMSYLGNYIVDSAKKLGLDSIVIDNAEDAVHYITKNFPKGKILICGSLYLVGEILSINKK